MICGIFTSILEIPIEGNDVLNAKHFGTKSAFFTLALTLTLSQTQGRD